MEDNCPKCNGKLFLLEGGQNIFCLECAWTTTIPIWKEWSQLRELMIR